MPEITVNIGGRPFSVACQKGEEPFLHAAADILNVEAVALVDQIGQLPEARMLLMAGLMLADKTAAAQDQLAAVKAELEAAKSNAPAAQPVDTTGLSALAGRAEALAEKASTQIN